MLVNLECQYRTSMKDVVEDLKKYLQDPDNQIESKLKAKYYLKLGNWLREKTEELSEKSLSAINED